MERKQKEVESKISASESELREVREEMREMEHRLK
jgi:hypothetical protein